MCLIAEPEQQLRVIHVGGRRDDPVAVCGGDATESAQLVLEPDVEFTVFVRRHLRLPTRSRIKVGGTDGRPGVAQPRDGYAELCQRPGHLWIRFNRTRRPRARS
jgi:hypothetical protein